MITQRGAGNGLDFHHCVQRGGYCVRKMAILCKVFEQLILGVVEIVDPRFEGLLIVDVWQIADENLSDIEVCASCFCATPTAPERWMTVWVHDCDVVDAIEILVQ